MDKFLSEQIITYLGNKRALLDFIGEGIKIAKDELGQGKISFLDIFSGSGVVSRYAKNHANFIVANDLENYSKITNLCYLETKTDELMRNLSEILNELNLGLKTLRDGFITELYAPKNDADIKRGERAFFTRENAMFLDSARVLIDEIVPENLRQFFIAPLIYKASVHANTSGVFKGFHKRDGVGHFGGRGENALKRICEKISLELPILSETNVKFEVTQKDANLLAKELGKIDVCYMDPPYNQHPYGSNYFMLNLLATYEKPQEISKISGIPRDWNRSAYNKPQLASDAFFGLCSDIKAKFLVISYNNEGFIKFDEFVRNLDKIGSIKTLEKRYNTYRGSRNLAARDTYVKEFLFVVKKH